VPKRCRECPGTGRCPAELALRSAEHEVHRVLSSISLSDLVEGVDESDALRAELRGPVLGDREGRPRGSRLPR
jgi:DNA-binding IscR family transcriptional regulator